MSQRSHICCIIPSSMLRKLALAAGDEATRNRLLENAEESARLRGHRQGFVAAPGAPVAAATSAAENRTIYDAGHGRRLPGHPVRAEGETHSTTDVVVNQAYDSSGKTFDFYKKIFKRNSIDGAGLPLHSTVHYGVSFNNAFWNGAQMVYGDGDGKLFLGFAGALDVVAHELTHGVTQYRVPGGRSLDYVGLSGALNESLSDVFGSMVKQWARHQTVDQADWAIGAGILGPGLGRALRSLSKPGTAWIHDDQPSNFSDVDPNGDPHTNSGVANRAFYLTAMALGGHSWERAGKIWYDAVPLLKHDSTFRDMRQATMAQAEKLGAAEQKAVSGAWDTVGVS
jgi:Zn-dependent metalloprotease